jgi:uncharacterized membrane protein YeaQ/YmgE (transglycosylase-associated protein family)
MNIVYLIISLICGAIGGNAAGAVMKDKSLGTLGNSLAGILGGGIGGAVLQALHLLPQGGGGLDLAGIVANIASGGVGGAVLLLIVSLFKSVMAKTA